MYFIQNASPKQQKHCRNIKKREFSFEVMYFECFLVAQRVVLEATNLTQANTYQMQLNHVLIDLIDYCFIGQIMQSLSFSFFKKYQNHQFVATKQQMYMVFQTCCHHQTFANNMLSMCNRQNL